MEYFAIKEGPEVGARMTRLHEAVEEGRLEPGREYKYYLEFLAKEE